jgi:hypothetical protein
MASLFYSYGDNRTSELLYGEYVKIIENTSGAEVFIYIYIYIYI